MQIREKGKERERTGQGECVCLGRVSGILAVIVSDTGACLNWKSANLVCKICLEGELSTAGVLWLEKIADFSFYSDHHP